MQYIKDKDIPLILQLIKSDLTYEEDATVSYNIYNPDMTTITVTGSELSFNSILNGYTGTLQSSGWSNQETGNYILVWSISDTDFFASTMIDEVSIINDNEPKLDTLISTTVGLIEDIENVPGLVWDEPLTGATHNIPTTSGRRLRAMSSVVITEGNVVSATINTITLNGDASTDDDAYDPSVIAITEGTGYGQCRNIFQYDGSTKTAVIDRDWKITPDNTSDYIISMDAGREHVNEGLARGGSINTIILNENASIHDNIYNGQTVFIRSGTGEDQADKVIAYDGTTKTITIHHTWNTIPDETSAYVMLPTGILCGDYIADSVLNAQTDEYQENGSVSLQLTNTELNTDKILTNTLSLSGDIIDLSGDVSDVQDTVDEILTNTLSLSGDTTNILLNTERILGLTHDNIFIDQTTYDRFQNMKTGRLRIYSDAVSVGTDSNVIGEYKIESNSTRQGTFVNWKQTRIS